MSRTEFPLSELVDAVQGEAVHGDPSEAGFTSFHIDSREIEPGHIFVPVHGERDGHQFITGALENGAPAVLFEKSNEHAERALREVKDGEVAVDGHDGDAPTSGGSKTDATTEPVFIEVDFTQQALYRLTSWFLTQFDPEVIAITGSVGKTTTKDLTAELVSHLGGVHKSRGNWNNEFGVPLTVSGLREEHDYLVVELAMRGLGEIQLLSSMVRPDLALITNVKESHIGRLGDLQGVAQAKAEICFGLKEGTLITPTGEALLSETAERALENEVEEWRDKLDFTRKRYCIGPGSAGCDYRISDTVPLGLDGTKLTLTAGEQQVEVRLPLIGRSSAFNFGAAAALAIEAGLEMDKLPELASELSHSPRRLDLKDLPGNIRLIDDSYNASFSSTREALKLLADLPDDLNKVFVFGDMLELGELTEEAHTKVGEMAAKLGIDQLVTVGYHAALAGNSFGKENTSVVNFSLNRPYSESREDEYFSGELLDEVESHLIDILKPDTAVLVKASRGLEFERLADFIERHAQEKWASRRPGDSQ